MSNIVRPVPDDYINFSVIGDSLTLGSTVGSYSAIVWGQWGAPWDLAAGNAYATFVSFLDPSDSFTYRWTLVSNDGTGPEVSIRNPSVLYLDGSENIGTYYLQNFRWDTYGTYGRSFSDNVTYTAANNAGSVLLQANTALKGIYQYGVNYAIEGTIARFHIVDPSASTGTIRNYSITGINSVDLSSPIAGSLIFSNTSAYLDISPILDNLADAETLYLNIDGFTSYALNILNVTASAPSSPVFQADSGAYQNLITNPNVIFNIPTLGHGMTWSYSLDYGSSWIAGTGGSGLCVIAVPDGNYDQDAILVRTVDAGGIALVSTPSGIQRAHTVDQTGPMSLTLSLQSDSGIASDLITNNGYVDITGLEAGATWLYKFASGSWTTGVGSSINLSGDGAKSLYVKQLDAAGNTSNISYLAFTLDTDIQTLALSLQANTGDPLDLITSNGQVNVTGLESGATWSYSLDGSNWTVGVGSSVELSGDGAKSLYVKQVDAAGNTSSISNFSFVLDTATPTLTLQSNSGNTSNLITNNGLVNIAGLESGSIWYYALDGVSWIEGVGSSVSLSGDGLKTLYVKQVDGAGNTSGISTLEFTLDTDVLRPILSLQNDSGNLDRITNNGQVNIAGLEVGATWIYSLDGSSWTVGVGNSVVLSGDGHKSLYVKQVDAASNISSSSRLTFTLDTVIQTPALRLLSDSGNATDLITNDGTIIIAGLETDNSWSYSLNDGNWTAGAGNALFITQQGAHSLRVKQTDISGNVSNTSTLNFVLDSIAPSNQGLSIDQGNNFIGTVISGYAPSNSILKVSAMGALFYPAVDMATGSWSVDLLSEPNGLSSQLSEYGTTRIGVGVSLLDTAGNESPSIYGSMVLHVNRLPTGGIAIDSYTGGFSPGGFLIARSSLEDLDGFGLEDISYRWQSDGVDVVGAPSWRYYEIRDQDIGKRISAVATYTDYWQTAEQVTSSQSSLIKARNSYHSGDVSILGLIETNGTNYFTTVQRGQVLSAVNNLSDVDGLGPLSYRWYVDNNLIDGATSSQYTLNQAPGNYRISVHAYYTDLLGYEEYSAGNAYYILVNSSPAVSANPTPTPETTFAATYQIPVSSIQSIGLSPDGQFLLIKMGGVVQSVATGSTMNFNGQAISTSDLTASITPVTVFKSSGGVGGFTLPELFTGPASLGLKYQLIEAADNAVVYGSSDNDFIKVSSANSLGKAVNGGGGNDVIDGGVGSTFVTGGGTTANSSTYFLDGRAPGTSWSTITDFKLDIDKATIWGFVKGVSSVDASFTNFNGAGAGGYEGLTLHFKNLLPSGQTSGTNANLNSITLSGRTLQEFGASSLTELNNQINAGTNSNFLVGATQDSAGTHGYLFIN
jgi:hypothetical protein